MKNKKINLTITKESFLYALQRAKNWLRDVPGWLFVQHSHTLDVAVVVVVLMTAGWLVIFLLYMSPSLEGFVPSEQMELSTDAIDRLEYWIEDREAEKNRSFNVPNPDIFNLASIRDN